MRTVESDTCYNILIDEPWRHYTKWNKLVTKDIVWSYLYGVFRVVKLRETESSMVIVENRRGWGESCLMTTEFQLCNMKKSSGDWLYNNVNGLISTELYI